MKIEQGKTLIMDNVLSLRKKMTQLEIQNEINNIGQLISASIIKPTGNLVTTNFAVETTGSEPLFDTEILLPVEILGNLPNQYSIKEKFALKNAIFTEFVGNPASLESTAQAMVDYIKDNQLQQVTGLYNVQVKANSQTEVVIHCYIGVADNLL